MTSSVRSWITDLAVALGVGVVCLLAVGATERWRRAAVRPSASG
jgi:hypothetical protein